MPGPAVYVVAAVAVVGTVAAVYALKEFVYEPHIAPKVEGWSEAFKRKRTRQQGPIAVPVKTETRAANLARTNDKKKADDLRSDEMSVELEDFVSKDSAESKSTGPYGTLRQRKAKSGNVLDESNVFVPFDPISPSTVTANSSAPSSPAPGPSRVFRSPTVIHSPLPRVPATFKVTLPPDSSSPQLPPPSVTDRLVLFDASVTPSASIPSSRTASTSPAGTELANSESTTSSFTPAVIGPRSVSALSRYGTPHSSGDEVVSLPSSQSVSRITSPFVDISQAPRPTTASTDGARSEVGSPFTDVHAVSPHLYTVNSPSPVLLSPGAQSSLHFAVESDIAALSPSLRSDMFSPSFSAIDDTFDVASVDGSDISSWASVGRRTPEH